MKRTLFLATACCLAAGAWAQTTSTTADAPVATPSTPTPPAAPATYGKPKKGGSIGNSYSSQMIVVNDRTLRITTRKRVSGSLEEINKPGSSTYKALQAVADAASLRSAVETKYLGYPAFRVVTLRNLTTSQQARANSMNASGEAGYTFAPGKYDESVELAIELTIELLSKRPADPATRDVYEVEPILKAAGVGN